MTTRRIPGRLTRPLLVTLAVMALGAARPGVRAGERLMMTVSPAQAFAPATLRVQLRIEPNAANRVVEIVAESADFYRSSSMSLDGDRAPRVITFSYREVPDGEYEIRGVLTDRAGRECANAARLVRVLSPHLDR